MRAQPKLNDAPYALLYFSFIMHCSFSYAFVLVLVLVLSVLLAVQADINWKNCGTADDLLLIENVEYEPKEPERGQPLNITASGQLKERLDAGTKASLSVKWGLVRIPIPLIDVCTELAKLPDVPLKCPVEPGPISVTQSVVLPAEMPQGKYDVNVRVKSQDGRSVACLQVQLSV